MNKIKKVLIAVLFLTTDGLVNARITETDYTV